MIRALGIFLLCAFALGEARMVTYTATSTVSQKDADEQAMAGLAVQIRANVSTARSMQKSEVKNSKSSKLNSQYSESIHVKSELALDGIELKHQQLAKEKWQSTASFNTDKAASLLRKKMRDANAKAHTLDSLIHAALARHQYDVAIDAFGEIAPLQLSHQRALADLAIFEPLNKTDDFGIDLFALQAQISEAIEHLEITAIDSVPNQIQNNTLGPFTFRVQDEIGTLNGMTVLAEQGKKIVAEAKTDSNGLVHFTLRNINTFQGSHEVVFRIRLPRFGNRKPQTEYKVTYTSDAPNCSYALDCNGDGASCIAIENFLSRIGFEESRDGKKLHVQIQTLDTQVFNGGPKKIYTVQLSVSMTGEGIHFNQQLKGSGSSEHSAKSNAIYKISSQEIPQALKPLCK
ncbi:MAG: hypothetical protein K6A31_00590 [Fibrobacter sp.]|nr:hypothetical protein [Fibrobacter sp.]